MINETMLGMMGTKILVLRGHTERDQFRFPRSGRRRIRNKWERNPLNWRERFVPPPISDDEYIVTTGPRSQLSWLDLNRQDGSQSTAVPQTILCTPAGEAQLRRSLGLDA